MAYTRGSEDNISIVVLPMDGKTGGVGGSGEGGSSAGGDDGPASRRAKHS